MSDEKRPRALERPHFAEDPDCLCFSTMMKRLRKTGVMNAYLSDVERRKSIAARCTVHGVIDDPVVGIVGEGADAELAFACPECSSPAILAAWKAERARELGS